MAVSVPVRVGRRACTVRAHRCAPRRFRHGGLERPPCVAAIELLYKLRCASAGGASTGGALASQTCRYGAWADTGALPNSKALAWLNPTRGRCIDVGSRRSHVPSPCSLLMDGPYVVHARHCVCGTTYAHRHTVCVRGTPRSWLLSAHAMHAPPHMEMRHRLQLAMEDGWSHLTMWDSLRCIISVIL